MSWEARREVEASNRGGRTETAPPETRKLLICARQRENHVTGEQGRPRLLPVWLSEHRTEVGVSVWKAGVLILAVGENQAAPAFNCSGGGGALIPPPEADQRRLKPTPNSNSLGFIQRGRRVKVARKPKVLTTKCKRGYSEGRWDRKDKKENGNSCTVMA